MTTDNELVELQNEIDSILASWNVEELPELTEEEMDNMLARMCTPMEVSETSENTAAIIEAEIDAILESFTTPVVSEVQNKPSAK